MEFSIDTVKTTTNTKNILTRIKSRTGIQNWNTICRWGFCHSLKQNTLPRLVDEKFDGVEMTYETFSGKYSDIYLALLINNLKAHNTPINLTNLNRYLKAHINRGVNILYSFKIKNVKNMLSLI
jgi:DNA sulfur modification protein DndE|tara:strand:- start:6547 stop:6918 length:372 start_codon:yes stop_codon:yes gene_type:complete